MFLETVEARLAPIFEEFPSEGNIRALKTYTVIFRELLLLSLQKKFINKSAVLTNVRSDFSSCTVRFCILKPLA